MVGIRFEESEAPDRETVDFDVRDSETDERYATVWGSGEIVAVDDERYEPDIEIDCDHPFIEWGDDDERGVCEICGATCDWHWVKDVSDMGEYTRVVDDREITEWHCAYGGAIKEYMEGVLT